jgi:hypothetical protein
MRSEWRLFRLDDDHVSLASDRTSSTLKRRCLLPGRRRNADVLSAISQSTTCRVKPTRSLGAQKPWEELALWLEGVLKVDGADERRNGPDSAHTQIPFRRSGSVHFHKRPNVQPFS